MDIEIRAEAVMEGRDYLALAHFMTYSKNKNSMMLNLLLLLVAVVGVYADFMVNGKMTFITIVAVLAVLVTFLLPEYSARRFVRTDKNSLGTPSATFSTITASTFWMQRPAPPLCTPGPPF